MSVNPLFTNVDEIAEKEEIVENEEKNDLSHHGASNTTESHETSNGTHSSVYEMKLDATNADSDILKYLNDELSVVEVSAPLKGKNERKKEKWYLQLLQIIIPFFVAGFGMVAAGLLFAVVSGWDVFVNVKEIIVLVPALLGLKGNLDMSLASRLSTQVNLGEIHNRKTIIQVISGNAALKLLQSIIVGLLASFVACLTQYLRERKFTPENLLTLIASSVTSASFTSIVLGMLIMIVILIAKRFKINPDNVGTPLAGSLGDLGTLITLASVGSFFYTYRSNFWIHISFIVVLVLLTPFLAVYSKRNPFTKKTLYQGWLPIITAMLISSAAGIILNIAIQDYTGIESYQPVVNGVGGNLVSIYASRLSTEIARDPSTWGKWAGWAPARFIAFPLHTFFGKINPESKTARLLMFLVLPGHITFFFIIYYLSEVNHRPIMTPWFVLFYLTAAFVQVTVLFIICYLLVHLVWRLKRNPDDYCISLLTSLGDLFGVSLLYLCFHLIYITGDQSVKVTTTTTTTKIYQTELSNITSSSSFLS